MTLDDEAAACAAFFAPAVQVQKGSPNRRNRQLLNVAAAPTRRKPSLFRRWRQFLTLAPCGGVAEKHRYFNSLPEAGRWRRGRQSPYVADMGDEMTRAATTDTDP